MYDHVPEFLEAFQGGADVPAATAMASTLTPQQLAVLVGRLEVVAAGIDQAHAAALALTAVPALNGGLLNRLPNFLYGFLPGVEVAVRAILTHRQASGLTASLVYTTAYPCAALIADLGWLDPAADNLWQQLPNRNHSSITEVLRKLESQLSQRNTRARSLVCTLGRTWTGSVDELFAAVDGILA